MLVADVFKVYLYADPLDYFAGVTPEDITSGILNVNIVQGSDTYEGPYQQIDTGQFTIVTRNPAMDPKINSNLKYNSAIHFEDERFGLFFRGFVTDIQVEYQRKDDPIITITGTDIFGAAQRVVIDQDTHDEIMALSTGPTWSGLTFSEFIPYMNDFTSKYLNLDASVGSGPAPAGFWFEASQAWGELSYGNLAYAPAKYIPQVGESYLEVINKYAQTNLTSFTGLGQWLGGAINVFSFPKYDARFWPAQQDPKTIYTTYDFSSDPADGRPYQSILLDNGFNSVINQVDISNESRFVDAGQLESTTESFSRILDESIEQYAISRASISTIYPDDAALATDIWASRYSENIFQVTGFPGQQIQQITFDNARLEDIQNDFTYSSYNLEQIIRIKHIINENQVIDEIYNIAGITHNITPDNWEMGFILKPSKEEIVYNYQTTVPTLQMNALTGDSNFNFTATLTSFDPNEVSEVIWALSANQQDDYALIFPYAATGKFYKDNLTRTGFTQTWNFDDDGILAANSYDPTATPDNPIDNRYGGYGPGVYFVYAYVFLQNNFIVALQQKLTVGEPTPVADFQWQQNLTNNFGQVNFTDTSLNHEIGEPDSYLWTFGDGTTSTERNPIKQYDPSPTTTTYNVSLRVFAYGEGGTKIYNTRTRTITLQRPTMTANFTWVANFETVTFTNTSTNVGFEESDAYLWDFGDGTTSTLKNPVKTFPVTSASVPTNFSVQLRTRNIWEQESFVTKTVTVIAENNIGNYPVKYIKLSTDVISRNVTPNYSYALTPQISSFQGRTSNTSVNLLNNAPLLGPGNVIDNISPSYMPEFEWVAVSGDAPLAVYGLPQYLTRSQTAIARSRGCGSFVRNPGHFLIPTPGLPTKVRMELVVEVPESSWYKISEVAMKAATLLKNWPDYEDLGEHPESFYTRINVDVATTITGTFTFNPSDVYGPPSANGNWINIGYFKFPGGSIAPNFRSMIKQRPLPMNTPYFLYTFKGIVPNDDKEVNFTSIETAPAGGSYLWTFGDGTTSTLKDPFKIYSAYGTYNVNLTIRNSSNQIVRSTTEPVKVLAEQISPITFAVN